MPDEAVVEDTVTDAQYQEQTGQIPPSTEDTGEETELIFGKYKDMDEAQKGVDELNQNYGKQTQEVGELRKTVEELKARADNTGAINKLVETLTPKEEPKSPEWGAIVQQFVDKGWDEEDAKRQVDALQISAAWQQQGEESVKTSVLSEVEQLKSELETERQARVMLTDDYRDNKDLVDQFVAKGMHINDAIPMAKQIAEQLPAKAPERGAIPPSLNGGRVSEERKAPEAILSDQDKVQIAANMGASVQELEEDGTFADMIAEEKTRRGIA